MDVQRLKQIGERIYNLQRSYNVLHGITRDDDVLPWRFTQVPSPSGNARGHVCHLDEMLPEYYTLRQWDLKTGIPLDQTLDKLQLQGVSDRIAEAMQSGLASAIRSQLGWSSPEPSPARDSL